MANKIDTGVYSSVSPIMQQVLRDMYVRHEDYPDFESSPQFYFKLTTFKNRCVIQRTGGSYYVLSSFPVRSGLYSRLGEHDMFYTDTEKDLPSAVSCWCDFCLRFTDSVLASNEDNFIFNYGFVEVFRSYHHYNWHVGYRGILLPQSPDPFLNASHEVFKGKSDFGSLVALRSLLRDVIVECSKGYVM